MPEFDPKAIHNDPDQEYAGQDESGQLVKQTPGLDPEVTRETAGPDWPPDLRGDFSDSDVERDTAGEGGAQRASRGGTLGIGGASTGEPGTADTGTNGAASSTRTSEDRGSRPA